MVHHLFFKSRSSLAESGFTVLEAVFAVSILAFGILAVATLQGSAIRSNGSAVELADATARISSQLEALTMLPFTAPELEELEGDAAHGPVASGPYKITWKVKDSSTGNSKTMDIFVKWNDRGVTKELSLSHILSNNRI